MQTWENGKSFKKSFSNPFLIFLCLFFVLPLAHSEEISESNTSPKNDFEKNIPEVHGYITLDYVLRATNNGLFDNDLWQTFALDVGDSYKDKITANFLAGYVVDLDGNQHNPYYYPFDSVYDGYDSRAAPLLYYGYIDIHKPVENVIKNFRVGQMQYYDFEFLNFIGAKADSTRMGPLSFNVFGGVPFHTFESFGGVDWGDWLVGSGVTYIPIRPLKFSLDYVHLHDDNSIRPPSVGNLDADLISLRSWYQLNERLNFYGKFTTFTDQVRDLNIQANWQDYKKELTVQFFYKALLDTMLYRPFDVDSFTIMGFEHPYQEFVLRGSKIWARHFLTTLGGQFRFLTDGKDEGTFNREFQRYYLTLSALKWPIEGTTLSLTGNLYNTFGGPATDHYGISAEWEQAFSEYLEMTLGTAYGLYKYNVILLTETQDSQDFYLKFKGKITDALDWHLRYNYNLNDVEDTSRFRAGMTWKF